MSGIFLSYSRADRDLAERVVTGLRGLGADVWWDEDMPGVDWRAELDRQLDQLSAVLVIWTAASSGSKNVMAEARLGDRKEKLVNVICGVTSPPPPFDAINGLPLDGWDGGVMHHGWERLVRTVESFLVKSGDARPDALVAALRAQQTALRDKQQALTDAEEAFREAKTAEGEAAEASHLAETAFSAAEEQLGWVASRRGATSLLRAAQGELDTAAAKREEAQALLQATAAALATASRAMTRARNELQRELPSSFGRAPSIATPPPVASESVSAPPPSPQMAPSAPELDPPASSRTTPPHADPEPPSGASDPVHALSTPSVPQPSLAWRALHAGGWRWRRPGRREWFILAGIALALVALMSQPAIGKWWHVTHLQNLANQGDSSAQSDLASLYDDSGGLPFLPKDEAKAAYWFEKAANQGDTFAQYRIAGIYQYGVGVSEDWAKAVFWTQKLAARVGGGVLQEDRANAELSLAQMYEQGGPNLAADPAQARAWYVRAAADGAKDAVAWLAQHPSTPAAANSIPP